MKTFSIVGLLCLIASFAPVQTATAQSNSTVRFLIRYGNIGLGNVDVELFDSHKPITVSNFLVYAQSGAYSNTIMHYCVPNFLVQGGFGVVTNPTSPGNFTALNKIPTRAAITNESEVGQYYGNVYGTLAMFLEQNPSPPNTALPNSATASWFFNLTNNASLLDSRRYTVFGRITSSEGTNTLNRFNELSAINRIVTTANTNCSTLRLYPGGSRLVLPGLPVGPFLPTSTCPEYNDLFNVQVVMVNGPDLVGPNLTIANPVTNLVITNATALVSGTVYDNVAVSNVFVEVNGGEGLLVSTNSGAWSTNLTDLPGGTNVIVIRAYDTSGNVTEVTRRIFHRVKVPISLSVAGSGTISGATNNALLEVGRLYTLTAKPGKGHLFGGWSGSTSSVSLKLTFMMETNSALAATFPTNLFPTVQGSYNGLFYDTNDFQQTSAGFLTLKVGSSGSSSGKLLLNGGSHSVKGTLNAYGLGDFVVVRKGTNPLHLALNLDLTNGTDQLTGTVTNQASTGAVWTAQLVADRAFYDGKINIAPQAGKYTVLFPADTNSVAGPESDGFGAVTVTTKGAVSLSGTLADGTKVTQKTAVSKDGMWPLYLPLYKGKGSLIIWVNFTNEPTTDVSGLFTWFKQTNTAKYYPGAFTNESIIAGSRFVPPTTNAILNLSNALVTFTGGNLAADFTNTIAIDAKSKVINQSSNKLTLTFSKSSGTFSGSVTPPMGGKAIAFKGAVLQKQTNGAGFFLGTNRSGRVSLQAE